MAHSFKSLAGAALLALLTAAAPAAAQPTGKTGGTPGRFDFYVLSLSWSPSYCAAEGEHANRQQCGPGRPFAFVVHGLWPQFEHGYPERCASRQPDRVPRRLVARYLDLMPSAGLIGYQWRKHGTCSGLSQEDYLARIRAARGRIAVPREFQRIEDPRSVAPQAIEEAFVRANPGLRKDGIAVVCDRRYIREVRICMTRDLDFRTCTAVDRDGCRASKALMPPNRGG